MNAILILLAEFLICLAASGVAMIVVHLLGEQLGQFIATPNIAGNLEKAE